MFAVICSFLLHACLFPQEDFDKYFTGQTLRFDYDHSGTAEEEHISLDKVRLENSWPGSRAHLLDKSNLGKYFFEVEDSASKQTIYSRGFASIYGEWETTGEAKKIWQTFHESQRFPEPKAKCKLFLKKRDSKGEFQQIYSTEIEPNSRFVDRSKIAAQGELWSVLQNGEPANKVDLLVLGDGYTQVEREKYHQDVKRLVAQLFATEPFQSKKNHFNVWAIDVAAKESGISNPRAGTWRDSPLGTAFNALDSDRYVLTLANQAVREIAALAPYDTMIILCNTRKYGGGGIFNLYATCASDTSTAPYVFVHEFGHSFAGLADEYYTSPVAYEDFTKEGVEPWEPNVTALLDPKNIKWKNLTESSTPIPTPWDQVNYDKVSLTYMEKRQQLLDAGASEEKMEELFAEVKQKTMPMLQGEKYFDRVGAFEGAAYQAKGLYRPQADCIMFTRNPDSFCKVCSKAIVNVIQLYSE